MLKFQIMYQLRFKSYMICRSYVIWIQIIYDQAQIIYDLKICLHVIPYMTRFKSYMIKLNDHIPPTYDHMCTHMIWNSVSTYDLKTVYDDHIWSGRHMIPYMITKSDEMNAQANNTKRDRNGLAGCDYRSCVAGKFPQKRHICVRRHQGVTGDEGGWEWVLMGAGGCISTQKTQNKVNRGTDRTEGYNFDKAGCVWGNWLTRMARSVHDRHRSHRRIVGV